MIEFEYLLSKIPIEKLLSRKLIINNKLLSDITKIEKQIVSDINKIVKGEPVPAYSDITLKQGQDTIQLLVSEPPEAILQDLIPKLSAKGIDAQEIIAKLPMIIQYLIDQLPADTKVDSGLLMNQPIKPSETLSAHFTWALRIADNPLQVLHLISNQSISKLDVDAIKGMYPEIYEFMVEQFVSGIIEEFSDTKAIPRSLKLPLGIFLETPILNVQTIDAYKKGNTQQDAKKEQADINLKLDAAEGARRLPDL